MPRLIVFAGNTGHLIDFVVLHLKYSLFEPWYDKTNKMSVHPAKPQISLGIRPVWWESLLCAQWVAKDPSFLLVDSDAQADLSLHLVHTHFVGCVMLRLILPLQTYWSFWLPVYHYIFLDEYSGQQSWCWSSTVVDDCLWGAESVWRVSTTYKDYQRITRGFDWSSWNGNCSKRNLFWGILIFVLVIEKNSQNRSINMKEKRRKSFLTFEISF